MLGMAYKLKLLGRKLAHLLENVWFCLATAKAQDNGLIDNTCLEYIYKMMKKMHQQKFDKIKFGFCK